MQEDRSLFSESFLVSRPLIRRLGRELAEAARDFRHDPSAFLKATLRGDGVGGRRRKTILRFGFALGLVLYTVAFFVVLIAWMLTHRHPKLPSDKAAVVLINPINLTDPRTGSAKADDGASGGGGGGGGGGKGAVTPASMGDLPPFNLTPSIVAPDPRPVLIPPALPVAETVMVDPRLQPNRDTGAITGLPDGIIGPPSNGPGSDGGMGTGHRGGIGPGDGRGVGPGDGDNTGGGPPHIGGRRDNASASVDKIPRPLNKPRPDYTEEARRNRVQGIVRARVLIGADGAVRGVDLISHLPDGLDEEAVTAIHQMRFSPAVKSGQPVAYYVTLEVEFNLR
ncbi:MAG TPA: energy transducer TonB [Blastocatellia bacterium]|nr:energy transducer TonB [Blastocatellia bacterium]